MNQNFKPLDILFDCTAWFVWDLVGNSKDRFSRDAGHLPLFVSHILQVLSMEPVAINEQSQLNCALLISALWPINVWILL